MDHHAHDGGGTAQTSADGSRGGHGGAPPPAAVLPRDLRQGTQSLAGRAEEPRRAATNLALLRSSSFSHAGDAAAGEARGAGGQQPGGNAATTAARAAGQARGGLQTRTSLDPSSSGVQAHPARLFAMLAESTRHLRLGAKQQQQQPGDAAVTSTAHSSKLLAGGHEASTSADGGSSSLRRQRSRGGNKNKRAVLATSSFGPQVGPVLSHSPDIPRKVVPRHLSSRASASATNLLRGSGAAPLSGVDNAGGDAASRLNRKATHHGLASEVDGSDIDVDDLGEGRAVGSWLGDDGDLGLANDLELLDRLLSRQQHSAALDRRSASPDASARRSRMVIPLTGALPAGAPADLLGPVLAAAAGLVAPSSPGKAAGGAAPRSNTRIARLPGALAWPVPAPLALASSPDAAASGTHLLPAAQAARAYERSSVALPTHRPPAAGHSAAHARAPATQLLQGHAGRAAGAATRTLARTFSSPNLREAWSMWLSPTPAAPVISTQAPPIPPLSLRNVSEGLPPPLLAPVSRLGSLTAPGFHITALAAAAAAAAAALQRQSTAEPSGSLATRPSEHSAAMQRMPTRDIAPGISRVESLRTSHSHLLLSHMSSYLTGGSHAGANRTSAGQLHAGGAMAGAQLPQSPGGAVWPLPSPAAMGLAGFRLGPVGGAGLPTTAEDVPWTASSAGHGSNGDEAQQQQQGARARPAAAGGGRRAAEKLLSQVLAVTGGAHGPHLTCQVGRCMVQPSTMVPIPLFPGFASAGAAQRAQHAALVAAARPWRRRRGARPPVCQRGRRWAAPQPVLRPPGAANAR